MEVSADAVINTTTGAILFQPSGDNDDYIQFETDSNNPYIKTTGSSGLLYYGATDQGGAGYIRFAKQSEESTISCANDLGEKFHFKIYNDTYSGVSGWGGNAVISSDSGVDIVFSPSGDTGDYIRFRTTSNVPEIKAMYAPLWLTAASELRFAPNADTSDYIKMQTVSNVPYLFGSGSDIYLCGEGRDNCIRVGDDGNAPTLAASSGESLVLRAPSANRYVYLTAEGGSLTDGVRIHLDGSTPALDPYGDTDLHIRTVTGGFWRGLEADYFTEHSQDISREYGRDFSKIRRDIRARANGEHPLSLAAEHVRERMRDGGPVTETEYYDFGTDIGAAGMLNSLALDYLITELCGRDASYSFCIEESEKEALPEIVDELAATTDSISFILKKSPVAKPRNTMSDRLIESTSTTLKDVSTTLLEDTTTSLQESNPILESKIQELSERLKGLEESITSRQELEYPDYSSDIMDILDEINDLEDQIDHLEDKVDDLEDEIDDTREHKTTTTTDTTSTTTTMEEVTSTTETTLPVEAPSSDTTGVTEVL